jgi:putative transcriptional regulator
MVGQLLVAPPAQQDEYWEKTVIYIYEQGPANVVGLVLNKPTDRTVAELAAHHGYNYNGDAQIYLGGPVNPSSLIMLHTDDWTSSNTMHIGGNIMISSDRAMIQRLSTGDKPQKWKLFLGMSVWAPMQLEGELKGNPPWNKKKSWITATPTDSILFGKNSQQVWKKGIDSAAQEMVDNYFSI